MTRIGRQIPHFQEVDVEGIKAVFSSDKTYRYILKIPYKASLLRENADENIAVILKNPSSADQFRSDATIRKVETYVYHKFPKAASVCILNIFALRATDASDVQKMFKQNGFDYIVGKDNDKWFKQILSESSAIICAWGGNSGIDKKAYNQRIEEVKSILSELNNSAVFQVVGVKNTTEPLHGLMWGYDYECVRF
ncbi:MAG: DUF1643 domain-containing protein [Bacteroidales bacterium]|nr:DUF1643 domain-containing protein [Bacteroidales bacterium]